MSTIKVALIEDDETIVQMYRMHFELSGGFKVKIANDGAEGLDLIESFKPDIVLMDMMMPKMSGIEALTKLRSKVDGKKVKVIALTNMKDDDTVTKIHKLGVEDYIVKAETTPSQLLERIKKALPR